MRRKANNSASAQTYRPKRPEIPPPASKQPQLIHTVTYSGSAEEDEINETTTTVTFETSQSLTESEFLCFICNSTYYTSISREFVETNRAQVSILCEAFLVPPSETQTLEGLISSLKEPFCESCLNMVKQLEEDIVTVNLLNKRIHSLKVHLAKTLNTNFPQSPIDVGGAYWVKVKMIQNSEPLMNASEGELDQEIQLYSQPLQVVEVSGVEEGHESISVIQEQSSEDTEDHQTREEISSEAEYEIADAESESDANPKPEIGEIVDRSKMTLETLLDRPVQAIPRPPPRKIVRPSPKKVPNNNSRDYSAGIPEAYAELGTKSTADLDDDGICRICQNEFQTKIALWKHLKRQHGGIAYKCRHCDKVFKDVSNRNRHEKGIHASSSDHNCETCGKSFRTKEMLYAHNKYTHQGHKQRQRLPNPSLCPHCGKVLSCQKNLVLHIRANHGKHGDGEFELKYCPICEKPFKVTRSMKPHIRSHYAPWELHAMGEKLLNYKCSKCPEDTQIGFNSRRDLIAHYETEHPNELRPSAKLIERKPRRKPRKYVCEQCDAKPSYTTLSGLQHHVDSGHLIHGTKIFYCKYCDKICLGMGRLKLHERSHPDIKPKIRNLEKKPRGVTKNYKIKQLLELYDIKDCYVKAEKLQPDFKEATTSTVDVKLEPQDIQYLHDSTINLEEESEYVLPTIVKTDEGL